MENYNFVPAGPALKLTGIYLLAASLLSGIFWLLYRDLTKAALAAFAILAFNFFFGGVHDLLKQIAPGSFFSKYKFVLPASAILLAGTFIFLKKRNSGFSKTRYYLNSLFLILIALDIVLLTLKVMRPASRSHELPAGFVACEGCERPDIYFILADEYAGDSELREVFGFDNQLFQDELKKRGFHTVRDSYSNYNYTPFAIASVLNMEYLDLGGQDRSQPDLTYCYEKIRDNILLKFLQYHGYEFYNHSVFDFKGQPKHVLETFLPASTRLITAQTFLRRFDRDLRFNLVSRLKFRRDEKIIVYANKNNNENITRLTEAVARMKTTKPKFVYTHLMMPHYPYYYDKNGVEQPYEKLVEGNQVNRQAYVEYLQFANTKLLALVDHIQKNAAKPPVIILMGDHGFRHFTEPMPSKYYFLNLSSIHLPSGNYSAFRDSLTGVNFFRAMLNTEFKQQMPYLKDSTSYLDD